MSHTPEPLPPRLVAASYGPKTIGIGVPGTAGGGAIMMIRPNSHGSIEQLASDVNTLLAHHHHCQGVKFTGDPTGSVRRLIEAAKQLSRTPDSSWASDQLDKALAAFTLEEKA